MTSTVISVNQKPWRGEGAGNQQEYELEFEVRFSDGLATNAEAVSACGVQIFSGHPENAFALAYKAKPTQRDDVCFWDVVFFYKTFGRTYHEDEMINIDNPMLRKPIVTLAWSTQRVPVPTDISGDRIENSAGQSPDPLFESDAPFLVFSIKANVASVPLWVTTYRGRYGGAINATRFRIQFQNGQYYEVEKGCARIEAITLSELKKENNFDFFVVSFNLVLRDPPPTDTTLDGWVFDMVDMGRMEKVPNLQQLIDGAVELRNIQGQDGQQITDPVLLNGEGGGVRKPTAWLNSATYYNFDTAANPPQWGDVVEYNGILYYCKLTNTNQQPPNNIYWRPLPHILYWYYLTRKEFAYLPGCSAP